MYVEFSEISQLHAIETERNSRRTSLIRGKTNPSSQYSRTPCSRCVNEYGSTMCCELCCVQTSHDQGERSPAGHHQRRPSMLSITTAAVTAKAIQSHGR